MIQPAVRRSRPRGAFVGSMILLCLFASGCYWWSGDGTTETGGSSKNKTKAHRPPAPLLKGWTKPAVAIVFSGEQHGYVEPCGCSAENQLGGLSHRDDLFRILRQEKGWPVTALDLGGTVVRNREQDRLKFKEMILPALRDMQYEALALGPEELRFAIGADFLLTLNHLHPEQTDDRPVIVAANVLISQTPELGPRRFEIVEAGGVKIGVTALFGAGLKRKVLPSGSNARVEIQDPHEALPAVLEEMKTHAPNLLILLAHADFDESRALARAFPDFDVIQTAGGPEDGLGTPERIGKTLLINVGKKGKHVGVVGFYPQDEKDRLRFELVELDAARFKDTPRMHEHMRSYQALLKDEFNHAAIFADMPAAFHPSGSKFVGAARCGECHTKAYAKWKETRHSHAYESLIEGREGMKENWIPRNYDAECLVCHVTGWDQRDVVRYDTGFLTRELAEREGQPHLYAALKGQQCENCHGPGGRHVELEQDYRQSPAQELFEKVREERGRMKLTVADAADARSGRSCYRCHDLDNSPNFNFEEYWEKVKHPGRD